MAEGYVGNIAACPEAVIPHVGNGDSIDSHLVPRVQSRRPAIGAPPSTTTGDMCRCAVPRHRTPTISAEYWNLSSNYHTTSSYFAARSANIDV